MRGMPLILGCAIWSFTVLLGATCCYHEWNRELGIESGNYLWSWNGAVGFLAQLIVLFSCSEQSEKKFVSSHPSLDFVHDVMAIMNQSYDALLSALALE